MAILTPEAWSYLTWPFRSAGGAGRGAWPFLKWASQIVLTAVLTVALLHMPGCPTPGPLPPVPPGPVPPVPPVPPGPVQGLRVLILEESADRNKLPLGQLAIILGTQMRTFLDAKTPTGKDGKSHQWRIWDKDVSADNDEPEWKAMLARPHPTLPWIVLADAKGTVAFEGPLPATVDETVSLIKKYAGP